MAPLSEDDPLLDPSSLTRSILEALQLREEKLQYFEDEKKARADDAAEAHANLVAQEQSDLDSQVQVLLEVQSERGLKSKSQDDSDGGMASRRAEMMKQKQRLEQDIEEMQHELQTKEKPLKDFQQEEAEHRAQAEEVRKNKEMVDESKRVTIEDLTLGVVNYQALGLDFKRVEGPRVGFIFKKLDPVNPDRRFSFVLNLTDENIYEIEDYGPLVREDELFKLVDELNDNNEFDLFVRGMRKAFSEAL